MYEFEEVAQMLDEIADSMPYELYRELNGGISLLPQTKVHPQALHGDLFILGEYIRNSLGNAIVFFTAPSCGSTVMSAGKSSIASSPASFTMRYATTTSTSRAPTSWDFGMTTVSWNT